MRAEGVEVAVVAGPVTTYFVLALALFSSDSYDEVIRQVTSGLEWASG